MNHGRVICFVSVLAAISASLAAPISEAWTVILQQRDTEKAESRTRPSSVFSLTVEKVPESSVIQCVTNELEQQGWRVLLFKKEKKQLLASRNVEAEELGRIADTKRAEGTIHWTRVRVDLILSFSANRNSTSVDIRMRILVRGETSHPLLRPMNWWPLPSNGLLESDLLAALKLHCGLDTKSPRTESR